MLCGSSDSKRITVFSLETEFGALRKSRNNPEKDKSRGGEPQILCINCLPSHWCLNHVWRADVYAVAIARDHTGLPTILQYEFH